MEHLSKKTKKNVQPAKEKKPSTDDTPAVSEKPAETVVATTEPETPKDPLAEPIVISDDLRKAARGFGIPVDLIVDRSNMVQSRIINIEQAIVTLAKAIDSRDEKLKPLIGLAEQIEQRRQASIQASQGQPNAPTQGGGLDVTQVLLQILSGGGGQDETMLNLQKEIMQMSIDRMKADISFSDAIKNAITTKIASKAAGDIVG